MLSLAAVLRKQTLRFQNPTTLSFEIAMSAFLGPAAPKILKTNQFYFLFVPDCAACNIQAVKIRQSRLQTAVIKA